ncbi:MAG: hypothetical protein LBC86_05005 [Oscillospiraceae bacterium]|jgi:DNA polymerase-3 subunit beta|nr:hypothetical protein [Oscillospiraceae bacterium]
MKIQQSEIAKKLKQLKSLISAKSSINQGVLFKKNMLMANNFELGVTIAIDADAAADEIFVIPPKAIDMIESLPNEIIDIRFMSDKAGEKIIVKSENGSSKFQTIPAADFQEVKGFDEGDKPFVCDAVEIEDALARIMYACAVADNKEVFKGVLLEGDGENLNIVACDGVRVAWNRIKYAGEISVVVPKESLVKAFSLGLKDDVTLDFNGNNAIIKSGDYTVYTRLYNGEFINYRKLLTLRRSRRTGSAFKKATTSTKCLRKFSSRNSRPKCRSSQLPT